MAQARAVTGASGEAPLPSRKEKENLSRREKEAIAAQAAKERYQKLHAEGKTDEAKADMARLKLIRQQREDATARKQAEKEEADARSSENKEKLDKEEKKRADALGSQPKKGLKGNTSGKNHLLAIGYSGITTATCASITSHSMIVILPRIR
ncbi:hypothetical protein LTR66_016390 [Elasticomyces elasticus]|nr:hypothetical protein LTR66_016390 [Elasticomyces elasticus]